ncbi:MULTISPECIES: nucleotidyltransferase family protein [unclassified Clostridium]|uniref:nucleotidyltransferase family protein n=1 Tax=unclassified Clostridium TaxID=2614128 RepID=UPI0039C8AAF9
MSNQLIKEEILNKLKSEEFTGFIKRFDIINIAVFGSILTEEFNEESDVDIAVLGRGSFSLDDILEVELFLERFLEREIDVVDLKSKTLDIFVKISILNSCEIIYSTDNKVFEEFCDDVEWIYRENENFIHFRKVDVLYE